MPEKKKRKKLFEKGGIMKSKVDEFEVMKIAGDQNVPNGLNTFMVKKEKINITAKDTEDEALKKVDKMMGLAKPKRSISIKDQNILTDWFLKKYKRYFYREKEQKFCFELAGRILDILENEPDHEIAKILKGE